MELKEKMDDEQQNQIRIKIEKMSKNFTKYGGFGKDIFPLMILKSLKKGYIEYSLKSIHEFTNTLGSLHGGLIATVLDGIGTFAYVTTQSPDSLSYGVTINFNINYISGTEIGEEVIFKCEVEKLTKSLCFVKSRAEKKDGTLVATSQAVYKIPPKSKL